MTARATARAVAAWARGERRLTAPAARVAAQFRQRRRRQPAHGGAAEAGEPFRQGLPPTPRRPAAKDRRGCRPPVFASPQARSMCLPMRSAVSRARSKEAPERRCFPGLVAHRLRPPPRCRFLVMVHSQQRVARRVRRQEVVRNAPPGAASAVFRAASPLRAGGPVQAAAGFPGARAAAGDRRAGIREVRAASAFRHPVRHPDCPHPAHAPPSAQPRPAAPIAIAIISRIANIRHATLCSSPYSQDARALNIA